MTDPTAPEPEEEPQAPPEPPAPPTVDYETALRVVADGLGWDPSNARFELDDIKRKKQDLERREREFESRQNAYRPPEPTPDFGGDVYLKKIYETQQETAEVKRILLDRERREREKIEREEIINNVGREVDAAFLQTARRAGMTAKQIADAKAEFVDTLIDIYPSPEMIQQVGSGRAVENAFIAYRGRNGNGSAPAQRSPYRDPRASFTIPAGSTSGPVGDDMGPRRPNESPEDYVARLKRVLDESGGKLSTLPERAVINPG